MTLLDIIIFVIYVPIMIIVWEHVYKVMTGRKFSDDFNQWLIYTAKNLEDKNK